MKTQNIKFIMLVLAVAGFLLTTTVLNGCKKSEPQTTTDHEGHEHAMPIEPAEAIETAKAVVAETIEQKTCPIMGGPINKDVFIEYEGKKVYFCCPGCETKFQQNPQQYIAKLPQFNE